MAKIEASSWFPGTHGGGVSIRKEADGIVVSYYLNAEDEENYLDPRWVPIEVVKDLGPAFGWFVVTLHALGIGVAVACEDDGQARSRWQRWVERAVTQGVG